MTPLPTQFQPLPQPAVQWETIARKDLQSVNVFIGGTHAADVQEFIGVFFTAYKPIQIVAIYMAYQVQSAVTIGVQKTSPNWGAEEDILTTDFDLSAAGPLTLLKKSPDFAGTITDWDNLPVSVISTGSGMILTPSGDISDLDSFSVTIWYQGYNRGDYYT